MNENLKTLKTMARFAALCRAYNSKPRESILFSHWLVCSAADWLMQNLFTSFTGNQNKTFLGEAGDKLVTAGNSSLTFEI